MQCRLLDMGSVSAVRSQSIYHAVADSMGPGDDPVVVILTPDSSYVSVGFADGAAGGVDLDACRADGLPLVRRMAEGDAALLDANQLLFQVIVPQARLREIGFPDDPEKQPAYFARAPVHAYGGLGIDASFRSDEGVCVDGRQLGRTTTAKIGDAFCVMGSLVYDYDSARVARALGLDADAFEAGHTCLKQETENPPVLAEIGEALATAIEASYGVHLIPSMPTPEEMDAIYEWDRKLID